MALLPRLSLLHNSSCLRGRETVASPLIENGCVKWVKPLLNGKSPGCLLTGHKRFSFQVRLREGDLFTSLLHVWSIAGVAGIVYY